MENETNTRIDKWLCAVRVYKTRSLATDECTKGHVSINGSTVKASRIVKLNDMVSVKKPPVVHTYKVLGLIEKRTSAKLVSQYMEDLTPKEELIKLEQANANSLLQRERGTGRPTKRDRREIDKLNPNKAR
jgi:ribosome-associated heat shock protein Hsp15